MKVDRRIFSLMSGDLPYFIITIIGSLVITVITVCQAYLISWIVGIFFINHNELKHIVFYISLFLLFAVIRFPISWLSEISASFLGIRVKEKTRLHFFKSLIALGPESMKMEKSGELANSAVAGIESLEPYFSQYIPALILAVGSPLIFLIFAYSTDPLSGLVLTVTAPLIPIFMFLIGSKAQDMTDKQWKSLSYFSSHFLDVLQGITTLKFLGQSKKQSYKISEISEEFRLATMKTLRVAFLSSLVLELVATLSTAVLAVEIGVRLLYGYIGYEPALFILIIAPEFYAPLRNLGARFHSGMEGVSAGKRVCSVIDKVSNLDIETSEKISPLENFPIRIDSLSYKYPAQQEYALKSINMTINQNEKIAIVGRTGSGKSTFVKIILKIIDKYEGNVTFAGTSLNLTDNDYIKNIISWAPQKPYLFNKTIKDNILLAKPHATDEEVMESLRLAALSDFVNSLNNKLDTVIGERAVRLSGGQAQRISLARLFLKNSPIVILDEFTSNLDPIYEAEIMDNLAMWSVNKTVITVAHRMNTIKNVDKIFVFNEGVIDAG